MAHDRILALKAQRRDVLDYCADLTDEQWTTPSRAAGWRVRDVIAHMGASCRVLFSPKMIHLLRTEDLERDNDQMVDHRRSWPTSRVLAEFARWSSVAVVAFDVSGRGKLGTIPVPLGATGPDSAVCVGVRLAHPPALRHRPGAGHTGPAGR